MKLKDSLLVDDKNNNLSFLEAEFEYTSKVNTTQQALKGYKPLIKEKINAKRYNNSKTKRT